MDAATALSRCALFESMDRLDLAMLSVELEEVTLKRGEVLFQKGDPGDAFYIVRTGYAQVYVAEKPYAANHTLLEPGQVFGEMAILTDEPRSTSIRAYSDLELWRMPAERFLDLLAKDRKIALKIEQMLSRRLKDTLQRAASAQVLARLMLHTLNENAQHLMSRLSLRPFWPAKTIKVLREDKTVAAALDDLLATDHLLTQDSTGIAVAPELLGAFASSLTDGDRKWLRALGQRMAALTDVDEAVAISFMAGDIAAAARLMADHADELCRRVPAWTLQDWLADLDIHDVPPGLIEAARKRLGIAGRPVGELTGKYAAPADSQLWQRFRGAKPAAVTAALLLLAAGWLAPAPAALGRPGFEAVMIIAATVPLMLAEVLPNYAVSIMLAAALVIPGIAPSEVALSGFTSPSWLMIGILLAISSAIAKSGLMYRLVLLLLRLLPGNLVVHCLSLLGLSSVLTLGVGDSGGRVTLMAPAIQNLVEAMRLKARSPGAILLGIVGFQIFSGMGSLFLTASSTNLLLHGLLPEQFREQATWVAWFLAVLAPHVLLFSLLLPMLFLIYRPQISNTVDASRINTQLALLGGMTRNEKLSIAALVLLGLGFVTRTYHGIPDVWMASAVCIFLFATGALDNRSFQSGVHWGVMVYCGIMMGLANVMSHLGIDSWLLGLAGSALKDILGNPYYFVLTVAVLAAVLRLLVPSKTLSPIMALIAIPLAISVGFNPLVAVLVILMAVDHTFFPFLNGAYQSYTYVTDGQLFSDRQARPALWAEAVIRIIALTASVPIWRWMGLM